VVIVKLFAKFQKERFKKKEIEAGKTVSELLKDINIPESEVGNLTISFKKPENYDVVLNDGDTISIFPKV
jgi:molybdopterin converting factor small subunit